ncbi:MAG TPA: hypothetical protein PLN69_02310 [bacterium]|nr:hypothetical protein [bacterium]
MGRISSCVFALLLFPLMSTISIAEENIVEFSLLTANVGNADVMNCGSDYVYKLCLSAWEKKIAEGISEKHPDIVSLQEVYNADHCAEKKPEKSKKKICYRYKERSVYQQVRRLLGPDYTIVCDGRMNYECIGVKKGFADVAGCEPGEICYSEAAVTHDVPDGCSPSAVIFGVDLSVNGKRIRVVNGHPIATDRVCRAGEIKRMFEGYDDVLPLALDEVPTLIMGDMNMDPYNGSPENEDVTSWLKHVGEGKRYYYLSGIAEHDPPYVTCAGRVLDHVITNSAGGKCVTLGGAPDVKRLDGYPVGKPIQDAPDHLAVFCNLNI